jgi:4-methyl-5(b-hydroxyethyl)-thiazole monophosphate biosynthesis
MAKALVPLADGFEDIEAVTIIDVLRRGGVEVVSAAIGGTLTVKSAHGMEMKADALFADVADSDYDAIILPGGGHGTDNLKACEPLLERLRRQHEERRLLCAICAAPTVLVKAEVLDPGVHVTCYPTCQMELDRPWSIAPVVADEGIITGQAPGSAMLFSLVVLQHLAGDSVAQRIARAMVTDVLS